MAMTFHSTTTSSVRRYAVRTAVATSILLGSIASPVLAQEQYEVQPGDTLTRIARTYDVTTAELVEANGLASPDQIRIGQTLTIPRITYTVQPGDTLSEIARDHGVGRGDLARVNDISNPDRIRVGAVLVIPGGGTTPVTPAPQPEAATAEAAPATDVVAVGTYTVKPGESLSEIARDNGVDKSDLAALNNISDPNRIQAGQVLDLPGQAAATESAAEPVADPAPTPAPAPAPEPETAPVASNLPAVDRATALAAYPSLPSYILDDPTRRSMIPSFERWSADNGVPVDLVMAVAWQESGWREHAVSSSNAYGVGQLMPATAEWIASDLLGSPHLSRENADDNIRMSARYLSWLHHYMGSTELALAGYFQGPNAVKANLADPDAEPLEVTEAYVASVLAHRRFFVPAR